ncbi:outer membrane beta-barrel protein [Mucilaginibacter sp.]
MNLKRLSPAVVVLLLVLIPAAAMAQYNYAPYGISVGVSSVYPFSDLKTNYNSKAYNINLGYNYSPYLPIAAELQFGKLSGGSNSNPQLDFSGRQFTNSYKALILHADVQLGEFIDYGDNFFLNLVKNFYGGTGIGIIYNNLTFIQRKDLYNPPYGNFPGVDKGFNGLFPLRVGYEIKFYNNYDEPVFSIDLGYRHNIVLGEGLDGYDDPNQVFKNNSFDQYRQITVGIKYNFGAVVAYNKNIRGRY